MRSWLFVPADSERKLAKALQSAADALVLDLEDSVSPGRKAAARLLASEYMRVNSARRPLWVRVNDLAGRELLADLVAVVPARPAGIIVPKVSGADDLQTVAHYLDALEASCGVDTGSIGMTAIVETPMGVMRLGEIVRHRLGRLKAVVWGAEDLTSALGAADARTPGGDWRATHQHARTQALLAANALGVDAIDTVYVNYRDSEGLSAACAQSRGDGFSGCIAIHPDQVPVINEAYSPSSAEVALAHRIINAFAGGAGAVSLDGKMYDIPHLNAARRLIERLNQPPMMLKARNTFND
jgi:citrate lyase subunit beta/citryl-CoA lyase